MTTANEFSHNESQTDISLSPPSLATCVSSYSPVRLNSIEDLSMWLQEGGPVSRTPLPVAEKEEPTTATSGLKLLKLSESSVQDTASLKTFAGYSPPATSAKSSKTWIKAGIVSAGEFFREPKWEHRINVTDSGLLLPTPMVPNGGRQHNLNNITLKGNTLYRRDGSKAQLDLQTYVRLWPTPTVDGNHNRKGLSKNSGDGLATAVQTWPTPTNRDWRDGRASAQTMAKNSRPLNEVVMWETQAWATPQARDYRTGEAHRWENPERSRTLNDQIGGKLSPDWVEWLMDWPVGWTSLEPLPLQSWLDWQDQQNWWAEEPADVPRVIPSTPGRVDRLKAIGNGQVSLCVAVAWHLLTEDMEIYNHHYQEEKTMNELITQSTELAADIGHTDEVSWTPSEDMNFAQYQAIGKTFQQIKVSLSWWVGDWMNFGERKFGEIAYQAVDDTGKSAETLIKWKAISARIPKEIRRADLTHTHHFYVIYCPEEQRGPLLDMAANVGLSSRELKDVVKLGADLCEELLLAVENYQEEEGGMTHETFMKLLNRFKLSQPAWVKEIEEMDKPQGDDDEEDSGDEEDRSEEVAEDDLTDFWENAGVPLTSCGKYAVFWEGISVRAALDGKNKPYLIWETSNE